MKISYSKEWWLAKAKAEERMTPTGFRIMLAEHHLSQREFARQSGVAVSTVNRWILGKQPIPGWVGWMADLLDDLTIMCTELDIRPE